MGLCHIIEPGPSIPKTVRHVHVVPARDLQSNLHPRSLADAELPTNLPADKPILFIWGTEVSLLASRTYRQY